MKDTYNKIEIVRTVGDLIEALKSFEVDQPLTNPTEIGKWVRKSHIHSVSVFETEQDD